MNSAADPQSVLTVHTREEIDRWVARFPPGRQRSAVISALRAAQEQNQGHLTVPLMDAVATHLQLPPIQVYEVASFYTMYNLRPVGKHHLQVCTNLPCQLRDGETALQHLCKKLGVEPYGTTADGTFTVQPAECLGACADAPVLLVNDREMLSFMNNERLDELVDLLKDQHA